MLNAYLFTPLGQAMNDLFKCKDLRCKFLNCSLTPKKEDRSLISDFHCKTE